MSNRTALQSSQNLGPLRNLLGFDTMSLDLSNAKLTTEKLFNSIPVYRNSYGEKLIKLSNEDIYYFESSTGIDFEEFKANYAEDILNSPFDTWINLGYNI